ncbi:ribbon-helix-helix protein, CopG family [Singulisphaera rosea]
MPKETKRPARMTLELPSKARGKLEKLSQDTDQSLSEVIRRALSLYDLVGEAATAGSRLIVRDPEGKERDILLPEFSAEKTTT